MSRKSEHRSPENLYLVATMMLFLILPFQNCSLNPVDWAWADQDPSYRVEIPSSSKTAKDSSESEKGQAQAAFTPVSGKTRSKN